MSSKQQFTITLGRSGKVVKRSGDLAESSQSNQASSSGVKRPLRDRYSDMSDEYGAPLQRKRLQREDPHWSSSQGSGNSNQFQPTHHISQDDLRFKLMKKKGQKSQDIDLRERLPRASKAPFKSAVDSNGSSERIPVVRSTDGLRGANSMRRSEPLDRLRVKSPDSLLGPSRNLSPPHLPTKIIVDKIPVGYPRPVSLPSKAPPSFPDRALPSGPMKVQLLPVEPVNVTTFLKSLGLEKYCVIFQAEEIDLDTLKQMGENDLKELGIPMGPRKKILLSLLPRPAHLLHP